MTGLQVHSLIQSSLEFFHSLLQGLDELLQNLILNIAKATFSIIQASLKQQNSLFPSALSNVQALDLFITRWVKEGRFISKEGSAETVTILSLVN